MGAATSAHSNANNYVQPSAVPDNILLRSKIENDSCPTKPSIWICDQKTKAERKVSECHCKIAYTPSCSRMAFTAVATATSSAKVEPLSTGPWWVGLSWLLSSNG